MGVGKRQRLFGQPIEVGCDGSRKSLEGLDPIIKVINGDEQDVGLLGSVGRFFCRTGPEQESTQTKG